MKAVKYEPDGKISRKGEFVLGYTMGEKLSFFRCMTNIGPAFGATLAETPKFPTPLGAIDMRDRFPMVASVGVEIFEVVESPTKSR